jgi:hypothetical protein
MRPSLYLLLALYGLRAADARWRRPQVLAETDALDGGYVDDAAVLAVYEHFPAVPLSYQGGR